MRRIWLITDTHFFHDKLVEYEVRPEGHTDIILFNWKVKVAPDDIVIHLGDVALKKPKGVRTKDIMDSLPGHKILVIGNHDSSRCWHYMDKGFDFACKLFIWKDVVFTHEPIKKLPEGCTMNIHGHLHDSIHHETPWGIKPWHKLLAIENTGLAPITLTEFLAKKDPHQTCLLPR